MCLVGKNSCTDGVCWCVVVVYEPFVVLPLFQPFLVELLPHILQNLPVVMLVIHLAWRNKFFMLFCTQKVTCVGIA